jgi:glutamate N-acetyltransferase/amino-acid N-acetyltransferase
MFASDPNWGRILAAVGRADIQEMDLAAVRIYLDEVMIVSDGGRDPGYREEDGQRVMERDAYEVRIELGMGKAHARVLTCDFSFDYVKINAEYRS